MTAPLRLPHLPEGANYLTLQPRSPMHDFRGAPPACRTAYAAAHVVVDPLAEPACTAPDVHGIDWDATLAFRHHLWSLGLGVADAMDTAQRLSGLSWTQSRELIQRSGAEARAVGGALVCGAMTDQLSGRPGLNQIAGAYLEQARWIQQCGGTPVLMASRHLAAIAAGPEDYLQVYDEVLEQLTGPVMLHWLGEAFDPTMSGYWGNHDLDAATTTVLELIHHHANRLTGIKVSLLDAQREVNLRRRLPTGVRMFTGDDFNYPALIRGDAQGHSDALLGAFDAIAAIARVALDHLDAGDLTAYDEILRPTIPLARHMFSTPTSAYKSGVVFLAWLNGHQRHFHMLSGAQTHRSILHYSRLVELTDAAGGLADPDLAAHRVRTLFAVAGYEA